MNMNELEKQNSWQQAKHSKQYSLLQAPKTECLIALVTVSRGDHNVCVHGTQLQVNLLTNLTPQCSISKSTLQLCSLCG